MADTKISALTELTGPNVAIATDVVPIVDTSVTTTKKVLISNLLGAAYTAAGDINQASAAGVAARLGIGTARQVPMVNAGATALAYLNPITLATEQASTAGTSIDFTSIPANVRRITIMFVEVSTNGTSDYLIQIGDSGGIETTGYTSTCQTSGGTAVTSTAGFIVTNGPTASDVHSGAITLHLEDSSDNTWVSTSLLTRPNNVNLAAGSKATSATLDRVRITTVNGTAVFDAGAINISYE